MLTARTLTRWLIALTMMVALAGLQILPSNAEDLSILPTVTPSVDLPDVGVPIPTVAVPTVVVPPVEIPTVEVPPVDIPEVDVPVDGPVNVPVDPPVDVPVDPTAIVSVDSQNPAGGSVDDVGGGAVEATAALTVTALNCGVEVNLDADAVVLGSLDAAALLELGCVPAEGVAVSVSGDAGTELGGGSTVAGSLVVPGLEVGLTVTVAEDAPDGFLALTSEQSVVVAADMALLFVNVDADADVTADLAITKISCGADVTLDADAVVLGSVDAAALLDLGCVLSDDVAFTLTGSGGVNLGSGATADGLLTVQDLEVGARVRVEEVVPDGSIALTRAQTVLVTPGLELLFVNVDADADVTADLTIRALNCGAEVAVDADAVVLGQLDVQALLDLGCELADGVVFDVVGEGDVSLGDGATVDGTLTIHDLDVGQTVTVTGTTPEGFVALTETQASIILPGRELIFVNVDADADVTADLTINKLNCSADALVDADASLLPTLDAAALLELGCTVADGVAFTVTGEAGVALGDGVTVDGVATIDGLALGATGTVTETVPDGFVALTEAQTTIVVPGLELLFVNVDADADLDITKLSCAADITLDVDAVVLGTVDAEALLELGCTLTSDVAFAVMGEGDVLLGNGLTIDGQLTIEDLTLGATVTVTEMVPAGSIALTPSQVTVLIPGRNLLFVNVDADADIDVDLAVTKISCGLDFELDAEAILLSQLDAEALVALGCELADDVAFTVTANGGTELGNGLTVDGLVTIEDIALGALVTVRQTVPNGFTALTETQAVVALPGLNLLFVNVENGDSATATSTPTPVPDGDGPTATPTPGSGGGDDSTATPTPGSGGGDDSTATPTSTPDAGSDGDPTVVTTPDVNADGDLTATPFPSGVGDGDPDDGSSDDKEVVVTKLPDTGSGSTPMGGLGSLLAILLALGVAALGAGTLSWRRRGAAPR